MKLKFDPNQQYQLDAINAVVSVFEGQPKQDSAFEYSIEEKDSLLQISGVANKLILSEEQLLINLKEVQKQMEYQNPVHFLGLIFQ